MPLVIPFVALGVALLALLIAYALTVIFTPVLEGLAREVPVVGGYLARGVRSALDYAGAQIARWANAGVDLVAGWFHGLWDVLTGFIVALDTLVVELADDLRTFVSTTLPALVHDATRQLRADVAALRHTVDAIPDGIADVFTKPLADFRGIEHGVDARIDHLGNVIRNVDLPDLLSDAEAAAQGLVDVVEGRVQSLHDAVYSDINVLFDQLGKIPLQRLLDMLAAAAGTAALVQVIAREAGLESAECRAKVRGICSTDPAAWQALLDVAGLALVWVGIEEFVRLAQDFARETLPPILEHVHGG